MIKAYAVKQCIDLTEGLGKMAIVGIFVNERDAISFLGTLTGVQGTTQGLAVEPVDIYESFEEHPNVTDALIRKVALSKLTDREKQVLGFGMIDALLEMD